MNQNKSLLGTEYIDNVLLYAKTLVGIEYQWWYGHDLFQDGEPFWVGVGEVKKSNIKSCSCTGLINLIRRKFNLSVPGISDKNINYPGGIEVWVKYLSAQSIKLYGFIESFDKTKHYRRGSILIQPKTSSKNQGHIALIIADDNKLDPLNNKLIHSYPASEKIVPEPVGPGVVIEHISYSHNFYPDGLYKYVFPPETWLI